MSYVALRQLLFILYMILFCAVLENMVCACVKGHFHVKLEKQKLGMSV